MKISKVFLVTLATLGSAMLAGCSQKESASTKKVEELTIVQMQDENNPNAGEKNEGFRKDMEKSLGIKINEAEGMEYSVGIEAMKSGKIDVLLVTPMSYWQAKEVANAEPLVTTTSMGSTPYKTVFIVGKKDTKTKSLEDLKGKSFAFVDQASSSGYMYPKSTLINQLKLESDKLESPGYFFKNVAFSGKHDSSIMGVVKGDYDAAAVAAQIIPQLVQAGMIKEGDIRQIAETEEIPNAAFIVRSDLPKETKKKLKEFYLNYENKEYFKTFYGSESVRFTEAKDSDYESTKKMLEALNIKGE
ncbi:phosphonate transport system substrate-binding protein [Pilibacter termitis]|uniref:Phosphonate transport system substrate-binding protein n=2 Tax=Pilibacter termitis TaxID=263852 RepID=A0A1T4KCV3_9ENTE|nr:phosphonate transport system substrate-binding protein [Pilibacter termitis]